jgi:hypothetical protein
MEMIKWYFGVFGDQWRLITDVLNYHPLTRGKFRHKDYVHQIFQQREYLVSDFFRQRKSIPTMPWRETGLPTLINSRVANLLTSTQFVNKSYKQMLDKIREQRDSVNTRQVIEFVVDNNFGKMFIRHVGSVSVDVEMR